MTSVGWYVANAAGQTQDVGQKVANAYSLYDMTGNVWEWAHDGYDSSWPLTSTDPVTAYSSTGVVRGGSFRNYSSRMPIAYRLSLSNTTRTDNVGFRLVKSQ